MPVKIRLKRGGAKNNPVYRIVIADSRSPRDGKFIEEIGTYWPTRKADNVKLDLDRAEHCAIDMPRGEVLLERLVQERDRGALVKHILHPQGQPP